MQIKFKKLREDAIIPTRNHKGDAFDLYALEDALISPGERRRFNIGIAVELPKGHNGRVAPRSGNADKFGLDVLAGLVDNLYVGEIGVILINLDFCPTYDDKGRILSLGDPYYVAKGDKIAQLNIEKNGNNCEVVVVDEIEETERGSKGFGSSGR